MILAALLIDLREGLAPESGGGMQISLLLLVSSLVIFVRGPGRFSCDNLLGWDEGWSYSSPLATPPEADSQRA
jgi:uncharacterized membrane protein YphA (DoxX/SURF4 family)